MLTLLSLTEHLTWGNHLTGHEKRKYRNLIVWGEHKNISAKYKRSEAPLKRRTKEEFDYSVSIKQRQFEIRTVTLNQLC